MYMYLILGTKDYGINIGMWNLLCKLLYYEIR